jgi:hypothetical protein
MLHMPNIVTRAMIPMFLVMSSLLSVTKENISQDHGFNPCPKRHYCSDNGPVDDDIYNFGDTVNIPRQVVKAYDKDIYGMKITL